MREIKEIWEPVVGFETHYLVSNNGVIKSKERIIRRVGGCIRNKKSKILKPSSLPYGHRQVVLSVSGEYFTRKVHRLVAETFIPNPESKPYINHKNGIPSDNRVENLEWCTQHENVLHSYQSLGRMPIHGETHNKAKLTLAQVREIRKKYVPYKYSYGKLGKEYGVDQSAISLIIKGKNWKHDI